MTFKKKSSGKKRSSIQENILKKREALSHSGNTSSGPLIPAADMPQATSQLAASENQSSVGQILSTPSSQIQGPSSPRTPDTQTPAKRRRVRVRRTAPCRWRSK